MLEQVDTQKIYGELSQLREDIRLLRDQVAHLEQVARPSIRTEHPHIIRIEGVHGGRPIIRGAYVSVQTVVEQTRLGRSPDQIAGDFSSVLTLAQVYDALSYYHEHTDEIEQYIAENREALWERTADRANAVRLYIDADITPRVAQTIRARGYDAVSAHEVGNAALSDPEHMAIAAAEGRAVLTCNIRDFTPLFQEYWFAGLPHAGVVVSEQLELGEMLRRVLVLLATVTADDMRNNWKNLAEFAHDRQEL